jgi:hypothetical protein
MPDAYAKEVNLIENARCSEARRHCGWAACSAAAVVPLAHLRMILAKASKSSGFLK